MTAAKVGAFLIATLNDSAAHAAAPLNYLTGHGVRSRPIATLTWALMIISVVVVVIIVALLLAGLRRGHGFSAPAPGTQMPVARPPGGASWIYVGVGISTLVLFVMTVWTVVTLAHVANPPRTDDALRIEVTGHQWWWEVRYLSPDVSREFITSNEIHIPLKRTVEVDLRGADVIHSFWVPALSGKTDVIPGQANRTWIEADKPGVYRGQCGEYCGEQHAHMGFEVIASTPEEFEKWWNSQLEAQPNASSELAEAQNTFIAKCGICHTVRGTRAGGHLGPDLTHLISRRAIGAALLPNTRGHRSAWIADPQHLKPGNYMPRLELSGPELNAVSTYLDTLN
ncbi:MAG: cytochrome c oxidase subunit II [Hyphomicrobiales bacterium]|nr:cytochrome c oxidase subunit II [Hyphomicrobiales bacterium]MBV9519933.1 cytochrome c oxidase subunit II [Hyphomicrobiales bacterium]